MRTITKKAEEIYNATTIDCRIHIKDWGYNPETDGGFTGVTSEQMLSTRIINDLKEIHRNRIRNLEFDRKHDFVKEEEYTKRMNILIMVGKTIDNTERNHKEFTESLKEVII